MQTESSGSDKNYGESNQSTIDKIEVIDSLGVCSFMGNIVKYTKRLIDEGVSFEDTISKTKERINKDEIYFVPESLTFLKNGGRVSPAVALIGNMLGIKPLLKFHDGEISKQGTVRTYKKAVSDIIEIFKQLDLNPVDYEFHVIDFDAKNAADEVSEMIKKAFADYDIIKTPVSINVCAHCGPGTVGFGYCKKW